MDVRPHLTAGIAIASTGVLVAALPAVVQPTPPDVRISAQVPREVFADVALRQSVADLIDAFFATGAPGVTQELLLALVGDGSPTAALINGFFEGNADSEFEYPGIPEVVRLLLRANAGPEQQALIDGFFLNGGAPDVLRQILVANAAPEQAALINGFFNGNADSEFEYPGIPEVVRLLLRANAGPEQQALIDGFFLDGGAPDVLRQILVANAAPQQAALINGFFNGDPNGGEFEYPGIPDVVRQLLIGGAPEDSPRAQLINGFFLDGGAPVVAGSLLLGASNGVFGDDSPISGAITAFFTGYPPVAPDEEPSPSGIPGLTHFIIDTLMGNVTPAPLVTVAPKATTLAAARTAKSGATADLPEANEPIDTDAATVTLSTAAPDKKSAAAAFEVSDPAVAVDPVASAPDDNAGTAEDVTDEMKSGNKAEVDPILLENTGGGGGLAAAIQTWNRFLQKLVGGKSTKPTTAKNTDAEPASPPESVEAQQLAE